MDGILGCMFGNSLVFNTTAYAGYRVATNHCYKTAWRNRTYTSTENEKPK